MNPVTAKTVAVDTKADTGLFTATGAVKTVTVDTRAALAVFTGMSMHLCGSAGKSYRICKESIWKCESCVT